MRSAAPAVSSARPAGSGASRDGSGARPAGSGASHDGSGARPVGSGASRDGSGARPVGSRASQRGSRASHDGSRARPEPRRSSHLAPLSMPSSSQPLVQRPPSSCRCSRMAGARVGRLGCSIVTRRYTPAETPHPSLRSDPTSAGFGAAKARSTARGRRSAQRSATRTSSAAEVFNAPVLFADGGGTPRTARWSDEAQGEKSPSPYAMRLHCALSQGPAVAIR